MSDEDTKTTDQATAGENIGEIGQTPLKIHKQYLKDLSFENPNAPEILFSMQERPQMDMNIGLDVQKLEHPEHENFYEITLKLNASAAQGNTAMFICDVVYAAAVSIQGMEEKHHHPLLFIEVPQIIFPFARLILANATNAGAYMPLQLSPVDFKAMYLQRFGKGKNQAAAKQNGIKNESKKQA